VLEPIPVLEPHRNAPPAPPPLDPSAVYDAYAEFYDSCAQGHRRDIDVYLAMAAGKQNCLEIGCGTGRVLEALAGSGLAALTGVDVSEQMLARARRRLRGDGYQHCAIKLLNHDVCATPLPDGENFDLAIVSWFTVNYIVDPARVCRLLTEVNRRLSESSSVAIEAFFPKPLLSEAYWSEERSFTVDGYKVSRLDERCMRDGVFEYRKQTYKRCGAADTEISSIRRYYSAAELANFLTAAGFCDIELIYDLADLDFKPYDPDGACPQVKFMIKGTKSRAGRGRL
jgi:ubiquinone/menaquinone biosynthesis C-methylase UbiE